MAVFTRRFPPFPHIWRTFKAKDLNSEALVTYQIVDLPEKHFKVGVDLMCETFLRDEQMCKESKLVENKESIEECRVLWNEMTKQRLSLACYKEGSDHLIGTLFLFYGTKNDPDDYKPKAMPWKKVYDTVHFMLHEADVFRKYGVDEYVGGFGVTVDKRFRKRNIAGELQLARNDITKAIGLRLTTGVFTSSISQAAAKRTGYQEDFSIKYSDLAKLGFEFRGIPETEYIKVMSYFHK